METEKDILSWLHTVVHFFLALAILMGVIFTIALFGRLQRQINAVSNELDNLNQVISLER